jgi:hypothetical protein
MTWYWSYCGSARSRGVVRHHNADLSPCATPAPEVPRDHIGSPRHHRSVQFCDDQ